MSSKYTNILVISTLSMNNKYERKIYQRMKDNTRFQKIDSIKNVENHILFSQRCNKIDSTQE